MVRPLLARLFGRAGRAATSAPDSPTGAPAEAACFPVSLSDTEWRDRLEPDQYKVLRRHGTEPPFTHPLNAEKRAGTFRCAGCDAPLFNADTKFDSGTGWPSFFRPLDGAVGTRTDHQLLAPRTEVHCASCGGHLGHVFKDGPAPTGLRYCMNGAAMTFAPGD
jgi:peptide-methionine (R)-S-oxide reductase